MATATQQETARLRAEMEADEKEKSRLEDPECLSMAERHIQLVCLSPLAT